MLVDPQGAVKGW